MINENAKKAVKYAILMVVFIVATVLLALFSVNLGIIKTKSVKDLYASYKDISAVNRDYKEKLNTNDAAKQKIKLSISDFELEKMEYESISQEKIDIVVEATTLEKYNIEYMWVKLGTYASANRLKIVLVEPGGSSSEPAPTTTAATPATGTAAATTTTTTSSNTTSSTTTPATTTTTPGATTTTTPATGTTTAGSATTGTASAATTTTAPVVTKTNDGSTLSIKVIGYYTNIADFIFDVETDKELRFKLDNISMKYLSGNNIEASFNVKNIEVSK